MHTHDQRRQATGAAEQSWVLDPALQVDEAGKALAFHTFQSPSLSLLLRQQPPGDYYLKVRWCAGVGVGVRGALRSRR